MIRYSARHNDRRWWFIIIKFYIYLRDCINPFCVSFATPTMPRRQSLVFVLALQTFDACRPFISEISMHIRDKINSSEYNVRHQQQLRINSIVFGPWRARILTLSVRLAATTVRRICLKQQSINLPASEFDGKNDVRRSIPTKAKHKIFDIYFLRLKIEHCSRGCRSLNAPQRCIETRVDFCTCDTITSDAPAYSNCSKIHRHKGRNRNFITFSASHSQLMQEKVRKY